MADKPSPDLGAEPGALLAPEPPSFLGSASALMVAMPLSRALGVVTGFIARAALGPEAMGVFNGLQLALGYVMSANTGIEAASQREIPFLRGKGEHELEKAVRGTMFAYSLLEGLATGLVVLAVSFYKVRAHGPSHWSLAWILLPWVLLWRLGQCCMIHIQTRHQFVLYSRTLIWLAFADFIAVFVLVRPFGLAGQLAAFTLNLALKAVFWGWGLSRRDMSLGLRKDVLLRGWRIGLPLSANNFAYQLLTTLDSVVVVAVGGTPLLGYYALGSGMGRSLAEVPASLSAILFPRLMERLGRTGGMTDLLDPVRKYLLALTGLVLPALFIPAFYGIPVAIEVFLPKFVPGLVAARILILGAVFMPLTHVPVQILMAADKTRLIPAITMLAAGLLYALVRAAAPHGIDAMAFAAILAQAVFLALNLSACFLQLHPTKAAAAREVGRWFLRLAWLGFCALAVERLSPYAPMGLVRGVAFACAKSAAGLALAVPLAAGAFRELDFKGRLRDMRRTR